MKSRITKATKRTQAIKGLVKVDRAAKALARRGSKPQAVRGLRPRG